ncbi:hypothetical protein BJV82DRAFT_637259 [Fennellomyces sp. T-0311]|nr:hypothetical protein BJV82DRAFT_637259 [Fennellomyces sp. T-0311]
MSKRIKRSYFERKYRIQYIYSTVNGLERMCIHYIIDLAHVKALQLNNLPNVCMIYKYDTTLWYVD